jgi:hypothetical protein
MNSKLNSLEMGPSLKISRAELLKLKESSRISKGGVSDKTESNNPIMHPELRKNIMNF